MSTDAIVQLYVGYFGRAADPEGLQYWIDQNQAGMSVSAIAASFSVQTEATTQYPYLATPDLLSSTTFINSVYDNLFGRAPDAVGLAYWEGELARDNSPDAVAQFILNVISGAKDDSNGDDLTTLNNRTTVARDWATDAALITGLNYESNTNAKNSAGTILDNVDGTTASVTTAQAATDTFLASGDAVIRTQDFTTGSDALVGTDLADTFIADDTNSVRLSIADSVDGAGGTDTLRVFTDGSFILPTISNVEVLELLDQDEDFDVSGVTAFTTLSMTRSDGQLVATLGSAVTTVTLASHALAGTGIGIALGSTTTGVTVNTSSISRGGGSTDEDITLTGAALASVVINATGATATDEFDVAGATAVTINATAAFTTADLATTGSSGTVTVTGAGNVTLGTLDTGFTGLAGSAATAAISATLNTGVTSAVTGTGADTLTLAVPAGNITVNTGAGNDSVDASAVDLSTTAGTIDGTNEVINGGEGTDTLIIGDTDLTDAELVASVLNATGFEILKATGAVTAFAANSFTGYDAFEFTGDGTAGGNRTYTLESADTLTLSGSNSASTLTLNPVTDGGTNVLNLTLAASTANLTQAAIDASQIETLNIVSSDTDVTAAHTNTITTLTVQNGTTINVSGAADLTFATAAGTGLTVNASTATGNVDVTVGGGDDALSGGTSADMLDAGAGTNTVDLSAGGNDEVEFTDITGTTTITGFASGDVIDLQQNDIDGAEVVITAAAAGATDPVDESVQIVSINAGTTSLLIGGSETIADFTNTTDVAAYLEEGFDVANGETFAMVLNNGTNSYIYAVVEANDTTIDAGEVTLIGVVNGYVLGSGDVAQTV